MRILHHQLLDCLRPVVFRRSLLIKTTLYEICLSVIQTLNLHASCRIAGTDMLSVVETCRIKATLRRLIHTFHLFGIHVEKVRCLQNLCGFTWLWDYLIHSDIEVLSLLQSWMILKITLILTLIRWRSCSWSKLLGSTVRVVLIVWIVTSLMIIFLLFFITIVMFLSILMIVII